MVKKIPRVVSIALLGALLAPAAAQAQNWVWSGQDSPDWDEPLNWTNNSFAHPPAPLATTFHNTTLRLLGTGPNPPANQNIEGLVLMNLQVGILADHLFIGGDPVLLNGYYEDITGATTFSVTFSNRLTFASDSVRWFLRRPLHFYGALGEAPGKSYAFAGNAGSGGGSAHFRAPVSFSGGINPVGTTVYFYGMETTGADIAADNPGFYGGGGTFYFQPPAPGQAYDYNLPPEKGLAAPVGVFIPPGVTAAFYGPFSGSGTLNWLGNAGGVLEFCAPSNSFTGNITLTSNNLLFHGPVGEGNNASLSNGSGAWMDLNGVDFLGRSMAFSSSWGEANDGIIRNQNPDRPSRIDGAITAINTGRPFGGVGDIEYSGDITATTGPAFAKGGNGTLTLSGTSSFPGSTLVHGGTLVLDHARTNAAKLAHAGNLQLSGDLVLRGNGETNTVQTVGAITVARTGNGGRVRISPAGTNHWKAVLKAATFTINRESNFYNTADFAPGAGGAILFSGAANDPDTGLFPTPHATFKGETFARLSDDPDPDDPGFRAVGPFTAYALAFDPGTPHEIVDITDSFVLASAETAAALRFNTPPASGGVLTLTLNAALALPGGNAANPSGAILVTPNVGPHAVVIDGGSDLGGGYSSGALAIHQYNTAAPLVIRTRVNQPSGGGPALLKTGPGELVIEHNGNNFGNICVQEGVVSFPRIAGQAATSPMNSRGNLQLNHGTLRYIGDPNVPGGHPTGYQISIKGHGILEASGTNGAPLTLTHATPFSIAAGCGNPLLTLGGTGGGVITGSLNGLAGGRLRKRGTGTWTLLGESPSILWGVDVLEGTLILDGTLGRDVRVFTNGVLAGSGTVRRNLFVHGGALDLDPANPLRVGHNVVFENGAKLVLPPGFKETIFTPVLEAGGKIEGGFSELPGNIRVLCEGNTVFAKHVPSGTLFMLK